MVIGDDTLENQECWIRGDITQSAIFLINAFNYGAATLAGSAKVEKKLQLVTQELQIGQVLLDLAQLTSCEKAYFVAGVLRILTHLEQLGNLLETELHFLRPPDKSQTREVTLKVDTDTGIRAVNSWEQPDLFVVAQRVRADAE